MARRTEYICDNCGDSSQDDGFINLYSCKMTDGFPGSIGNAKADLCEQCAYRAVVFALNGKTFTCGPQGATQEVQACSDCGKPSNDYHHCCGKSSTMFRGGRSDESAGLRRG